MDSIGFWEKASKDLNFRITAPFTLTLSSGLKLKVALLVHNFGASKGMIILDSFDLIASHVDEVVDSGYGFSVIDKPTDLELYDIDDFKSILKDWGWCGSKGTIKPDWLK